jgi:hypothetical protein
MKKLLFTTKEKVTQVAGLNIMEKTVSVTRLSTVFDLTSYSSLDRSEGYCGIGTMCSSDRLPGSTLTSIFPTMKIMNPVWFITLSERNYHSND